MLGGRISNQDEEDVEDELAALQAELVGEGQQELPSVPKAKLPQAEAGRQGREEPVAARARQAEGQAMLAS